MILIQMRIWVAMAAQAIKTQIKMRTNQMIDPKEQPMKMRKVNQVEVKRQAS